MRLLGVFPSSCPVPCALLSPLALLNSFTFTYNTERSQIEKSSVRKVFRKRDEHRWPASCCCFGCCCWSVSLCLCTALWADESDRLNESQAEGPTIISGPPCRNHWPWGKEGVLGGARGRGSDQIRTGNVYGLIGSPVVATSDIINGPQRERESQYMHDCCCTWYWPFQFKCNWKVNATCLD